MPLDDKWILEVLEFNAVSPEDVIDPYDLDRYLQYDDSRDEFYSWADSFE